MRQRAGMSLERDPRCPLSYLQIVSQVTRDGLRPEGQMERPIAGGELTYTANSPTHCILVLPCQPPCSAGPADTSPPSATARSLTRKHADAYDVVANRNIPPSGILAAEIAAA